jgi:hypothetical protein
MAKTSEIIHPRAISSMQLKAVKAGDRIFNLSAIGFPLLIM